MLQDSIWGMTAVDGVLFNFNFLETTCAKAPTMCGYWDSTVGGYHAVVLYNCNLSRQTIWAMDPGIGAHIRRPMSYYFSGIFGWRSMVFGYLA